MSVGYVDSYVGEGQISYAGPGAVARARLALEIVAERLRLTGVPCREVRYDLIGVDSILGPKLSAAGHEPSEVRVRVIGRTDSLKDAVRIGNEVEALYLNGPAGGGGVTKSAREVVGIRSILLPEDLVEPAVSYRGELRCELRAIAHSRTGDKGDTSNISVIAYDAKDYPLLERHVTAECVKEHFAEIVQGDVVRYALPGSWCPQLRHA